VNIALVGAGGRGLQNMRALLALADAQVMEPAPMPRKTVSRPLPWSPNKKPTAWNWMSNSRPTDGPSSCTIKP
jgi:hypothetical protein